MKHLGFRRPFPGTLRLACVLVALLLWPLQPVALVAGDEPYTIEDFVVDVVELDDGRTIVGLSTPLPPPDVSGLPAAAAVEEVEASAVQLSGVPAFDWCYGCSATAAAMLFGYYDRVGWDNMYAGPANGGVCPLTNDTWGSGESPLSATHQGLDDLATRGHVDDYYVGGSASSDPYYDNWTEHGYADCTADFMGTSQYYNWDNVDGSTRFYNYSDNEPLYDFSGYEGGSSPRRDGTHGMRLFAESRGYAVVLNYNQYIYGFGGINAGFTFGDYCDEIDAGRPVLIQVAGHTMLGVGYDGSSTVLLHDTWDHSLHSMTWGGSYAGLTHYGVSVIELEAPVPAPAVSTEPATNVEETTATLHGTVDDDGGQSCQYRFRYGTSSGAYESETSWTGSVEAGDSFSEDVSGLDVGRTYYFVAQTRNSGGVSSGTELSFTTKPGAPTALAATPDEHIPFYRVNLSWLAGDGASWTHVRVKQGAYPSDPADGDLVYDGDGTSFAHSGLEPSTTYYYRAWSRVQDAEGVGVWSDDFADAVVTTAEEPPTVSFSLALQPGWNMVSVPLLLPDMSISSVFSGAEAVYTWYPSTKSYVQPQELDTTAGYWVAVTTARTLEYVGVPVNGWSVPLDAGWYLAGSVCGGEADFSEPDDEPGGSVEGFTYSWNPLTRSYDYSAAIAPGRGHWIAATASSTLTVEYIE